MADPRSSDRLLLAIERRPIAGRVALAEASGVHLDVVDQLLTKLYQSGLVTSPDWHGMLDLTPHGAAKAAYLRGRIEEGWL